MSLPGLRALRRYYATFFFALFLFFLFVSDFRHLRGYAVALFLQADPLTAVAGFLTSHTLYKSLAWALIILIPTLFLGRFFCSWVCPLGILNQATSHLLRRRRPIDAYRENDYRPIFRLKYYLLAGLLVFALFGGLQTGLLDPIALLVRSFAVSVLPALHGKATPLYQHQPYFHGGILIALILIAIILANRFMTRFWCRVLCPLGALLGVLALRAPLRIRRDVDRCTACSRCLEHCQGASDPHAELRVSECHLCMNCIEACSEGALHYGLARPRSSIHLPLDIGRRRLVESSVAAMALFPMLRSSQSDLSNPAPLVIRPPGSLPEAEFLARCIKCAACMRVCPTNVLQPALLEAGLEGLWTPILINTQGYCEHHCVLCGQVCPTAAIRPITPAEKVGAKPFTQPIRLGTAFFDHGRCLPWAMHIPCIVCEEMCPTSPKAIWFQVVTLRDRDSKPVELKQPFVEPARCIGCGICENRCPVVDQAAIRVTAVGETRSKRNRMILKEPV
ncbi:MAG: 4Fe-4S binding protein [Magnetococcales bacterium]|nr:4Fe-4S binding protein [Magnetococcales bacterium]